MDRGIHHGLTPTTPDDPSTEQLQMQKDSSTPCASCGGDRMVDAAASGIGRRTFLAQTAILAAAAALAACGSGGSSITAPPSGGSGTIKLSDYPTLANLGGVALVNISGFPVAVVRTDTSTYIALSRICPHQGSTVNPTSTGFLCPNHGAQFSKTGVWQGGQRTGNMYSYPTSYDAASGTLSIG